MTLLEAKYLKNNEIFENTTYLIALYGFTFPTGINEFSLTEDAQNSLGQLANAISLGLSASGLRRYFTNPSCFISFPQYSLG